MNEPISNFTVCELIRRVPGGYIVRARHPYGGSQLGCSEVVCATFLEVVELLRKCANEEPDAVGEPLPGREGGE